MISIQKKFLFIHVPKTGGNSIQNILREFSEDKIVILSKHQDGIERFEVRNDKYKITKHSTLSDYKSVLNADTYRSIFKFAGIRNPWDMMVSYYFSPHRGVSEWNRAEFLRLLNHVPTLSHYIYEKPFLEKDSGNPGIQNINIGNIRLDDDIDFLIRFEQLVNDFNLVCEKLDIPYSPLPKRNCSNRKHYSAYYDDELKEVVRLKFMEEILYGNYHFENA
jgi:hypothetical protein